MLIVAVLAAAVPASEIRLEVQHEGALILGTIDEVPVTIYAPESEEERPLRVSVNVGSFDEVVREDAGRYRTRYQLPKTKHPQVALVAVWRETGPNAPITFLRIPLSGKTTLPVGTHPGSKVTVTVGGEVFGPVVAGKRGRAVVPIVVPPGVRDVLARSTSGTTESQKTVPVDLPPYNRLTLAVTPHVIEADGRSSCTAHVFYDSESPPALSSVAVTAPGGSVAPLGGESGHYRFSYVPERGKNAAEVALAARVTEDKTSKAETILSLGSPVPQRLVIRPQSGVLLAGSRARGELQILLMDKLGLGVPGRKLTIAAGAGKAGEARDLGEGRYAIAIEPPDQYPENGRTSVVVADADRAEVTGAIQLSIEPPPWPARALVSIDPSIPISDGTAFTVDVRATDFAGRPFEQGLVLTASTAQVSSIEYLGRGRYRAQVTPQRGTEAIDIRVAHRSGRFQELHHTVLRAPPPVFTLGAKVGGAYHSELVPTGALELALRIPLGERRFSVFTSAGYRQVKQELNLMSPVLPPNATITSRIDMIPIALGFAYDVFVAESWRAYLAAAGTLIPFRHHVKSDLFDTPTERGIGGGGEATLGLEWLGLFIEATGGYTRITSDGLNPGPDILAMLLAGYRLGVL